MKKILIIGIGAGDPDFVTMQAAKALNAVDVFFMLEKGAPRTPWSSCAARSAGATAGTGLSRRRGAEPGARHPAGRLHRLRRRSQPRQAGAVRADDRRRAGGRAGRGGSGLGRSLDLRQHDPQHRGDRGAAGDRLRGHSRHQRGAGAGGTAQDHAQYHRPAGRDHDRPAAAEGWPAGVDSVVVMLDGERPIGASPTRTSTSTGAPISARRTRS